MTPLDVALIFFLFLVVVNYRLRRSVLYPPFIFSLMFLLDLIVVRSGLIEINPLHADTLGIVASGAAVFSLGGVLAGLAPRGVFRAHLSFLHSDRRSVFIGNLIAIVLLCGLPVMLYEVIQLSRSVGGGFNILAQAREAMVEAAESGQTNQSFVMDYYAWFATLAALLLGTEKWDRRFWFVTAIAFCASILSTGRTNLLMLIGGLSAIRLLRMKRESIGGAARMLRWPMAIFVVLYIVLIFTNKSTEGMVGGVTGIATFFVLSYIAGPLAGFDSVVQTPGDFARTSSHTLEFPLKVAAALHLTDYTVPSKFDTFIMVPFPTNVYTVFKFYFLELGIGGTMAVMLMIGLLHSLLYLRAKQGGRFSTFLFAMSVYSVLMVFFDDAYYSLGSYLRAVAIGIAYFYLSSLPLRVMPRVSWKKQFPAISPRCAAR